MDVREQFGQLLRERRLGKKLTQEALAFLAGMNVTYLSDIERGKSAPSLALLVDLSLALEIHPAELIEGLQISGVVREGGRKRPKDD